MNPHNPLAEDLNKDLQDGAPQIYQMLSARGQAIYFPFKGVLGQTAEAKKSEINATIGTAFEEDGSALALECMEALVNISSDYLSGSTSGIPSQAAPRSIHSISICFSIRVRASEPGGGIRVIELFALGLVLSNLGRYEEAMRAFKQAKELDPQVSETQVFSGKAYLDAGLCHQAIECFRDVILIDQGHAQAHYNLGRAYLSVGDVDLARQEQRILEDLDANLAGQLHDLIHQ